MKKNLYQALADCPTEEEVKFAFIQFFRAQLPKTFKFDSRKNIDFYTPQILFEFKFDVDFQNIEVRARAFSQALYYIRRLKYGIDFRVPSRFIAVVDKKSAAVLPSENLSTYFADDRYDWDRAPSTPDKSLIADLTLEPIVQSCRVYDFPIVRMPSNSLSASDRFTCKNKPSTPSKRRSTRIISTRSSSIGIRRSARASRTVIRRRSIF